MKKFVFLLLIFSFSLTLPLYSAGTHEENSMKKPVIALSILPQQYAVDRIANGLVETFVLVGEGQSPHSYEPTPRQMALLSSSSAWILSGTDFEVALKSKIEALYPNLPIIDGTKGVTFRVLEEHGHEDEEEHHEHETLNYDKHTWLSYEPYKILISHALETLTLNDPTNAGIYKKNATQLIEEIDTLFASLYKELAFLEGSTVFVFHPSFGYFLDEFGIKQEAVETGGKEPTAKNLVALIEKAREEQVKTIFVQAQFPTQAAKNVADAVGAKILPLDPLAYDWITNIKHIASALIEGGK
ncbi:MAG: metal ABC transporter substrate-binding protein [Spirochaetia bacterium]|nr:metal ABC transporter substrate-binding protein [Spirochaetia bacterium]